MVNTNNLKKGIVLNLDNTLFEVLEANHYKPGKGNAFVRAKLRNLATGNVLEKRLPNGAKVEDVFIEKKTMQYLYAEGDSYVFMDTETYDQNPVPGNLIDNDIKYLREGDEIIIKYHQSDIVGIELPSHVILEVTYTEPAIKGDTATSTFKPLQLETGLEIQGPLFINKGDKVRIDTRTGEYVERA